LFCRLKRESRAEIDLQEIVLGSVNDIPGGFGEYPNMGSKAILEPSTKVAQQLVALAQASIRAYPIVPIDTASQTHSRNLALLARRSRNPAFVRVKITVLATPFRTRIMPSQ
jgi:hypothetical protein